ncbi:hypothetical protein QQ020_20100 [Fulvivirgaceae bacterium BMA12]|uniref:Uncharacterized protein n=1 Tax=Agaribacillus aureus TaxID=3051825 RepID=A0ABT8L9G0_9BACT|nr:hypothetical protein [Fulvivirgaceae bacterium BMA12]
MTYQINVYYNDVLLFSTDKNGIDNKKTLNKIMAVFKEKFPFKDGYDFQVLGFKCRERNYTLHYVLG